MPQGTTTCTGTRPARGAPPTARRFRRRLALAPLLVAVACGTATDIGSRQENEGPPRDAGLGREAMGATGTSAPNGRAGGVNGGAASQGRDAGTSVPPEATTDATVVSDAATGAGREATSADARVPRDASADGSPRPSCERPAAVLSRSASGPWDCAIDAACTPAPPSDASADCREHPEPSVFVYRSRACWERWHPGKVATVDFAEEIVATVCVWRDPGEQIVLEGVTGCGTQARVSASAYGSCIQDGIINCPYWSFGVILPATVQDVSATFAETSPAHTVLTDAGVPACVSEAPPDCGDPIDPGSDACWRGCETDTDCALVEASACACDEGGRRVAVRADQAMHWPTTTPCAAVNRCSDCDAGYAGARAACVSGRCDVECDGAATACDATDPLAFGACGQALGVAYNGYGCSFVSGCSGAPDAGALYPSLDACRAACTRTCADTAAAIGAFIDENKGCTRSSDCTPVETNYEPAIESCGCTTYLNAGFDRDEWAALDALWSNTGDSTMCGVGSCCDGEVHPPTCFEGLCREGEWPVGPLCSFRSTPADCAADPRCAWLAPGCPPGQHVPTEGCYHACSSGPCPGGFDCVTDDGGACTDATAASARVCVVL